MKTKIIYVIVCNESNLYLEQALLSIISLKRYNHDASIEIITDHTSGEYIKKREIERIVGTINVRTFQLPLNLNNKQKSRYLKTKLRDYIEGDYLFVDTDTIFVDNISEIDNFSVNIAAVLDKHLFIENHLFKEDIVKFANQFKWETAYNKYFNSGVMYVKDNVLTRKFYSLWHEYWVKGSKNYNINIDQPSLAKANEECEYIITELDGIYNCQINENGLRYLVDSKIIHYFASNDVANRDPSYIFADKKILQEIRSKGITEELDLLLSTPKSAFNRKCTIIGGIQCDLNRSPIVEASRRFSQKFPMINSWMRKISLLRTIGK